MPCRVVHHAAHHVAQVRVGISRGVVELINRQQRVVEILVRNLLHAVSQRSMGTDQYLCPLLTEELNEASLLVLLVLHVRQVEVRSHLPVSKESVGLQLRVLE